MGARCQNCGFPEEDHPEGECTLSHVTDWRFVSLQNQLDAMGLHIQAMKIKVSDTPQTVTPMTLAQKRYYLACPYTHKNPAVQWVRTDVASSVAAYMMSHESIVFSPITHGHGIAPHMDKDLAASHEFWMCQCLPMIEWADFFVLIPLAGWRESRGIQRELLHAKALGKPLVIIQLTGNPMCELFNSEEDLQSAGLFGSTLEIM